MRDWDSWLFRIVRNAWIDEVRSRKRHDTVFAAEAAGEHIGVDTMQASMDLMTVQSAMAKLPEDQREAVSLVLVEGLPYKEAAEVLEIAIGTLTSRLARGRDALQDLLAVGGRTSMTTFSDEALMAYADGELDSPTRDAVAAALRDDPQMAARVEQHRALKTRVQAAYAAEVNEAPPERLLAVIRGRRYPAVEQCKFVAGRADCGRGTSATAPSGR